MDAESDESAVVEGEFHPPKIESDDGQRYSAGGCVEAALAKISD